MNNLCPQPVHALPYGLLRHFDYRLLLLKVELLLAVARAYIVEKIGLRRFPRLHMEQNRAKWLTPLGGAIGGPMQISQPIGPRLLR